MHVFVKSIQGIRDTSRYEDLLAEVDNADFDVMFLSESWREDSETFLTAKQHKKLLSGGLRSKGVGICLSRQLNHQAEDVSFHAYSSRVSSLSFNLCGRSFLMVAVYFPTTCDSDEAVDEIHDLLTLNISNLPRSTVVATGGDFYAALGSISGMLGVRSTE